MKTPRIVSVEPHRDYSLIVEFENHSRKKYLVEPLLSREPFQLLKSWPVFRSVQIEQGGYAVSWNEDIDLSEYELWKNGASLDD